MAHHVVLFSREGSPAAPGLVAALKMCAFEIRAAATPEEVFKLAEGFSPDCTILLCTGVVDNDALKTAEQVRRIDGRCPLLIVASSVSAEAAICAMRAGVSDLLEAGSSTETVITALRRFAVGSTKHPNNSHHLSQLVGGSKMVGHSNAIARVRSQITRVAASEATVLITGESGTGKEVVAELIHRNSSVSARPFVVVNCAALPDALLESELFGHERGAFTGASLAREGRLQYASGGTLFLDEVGDMSPIAQAKILRAIENRVVQRLGSNVDTPVQLRLLAATNQDLESLIREKKFRQDLYFRLNVVRLDLPPLRERIEDVPDIAEHILSELSQRQSKPPQRIEGDVVRRFQMYSWPGNIRELRNILESIFVLSPSRSIGLSDVPPHIRQTLGSSCRHANDERSKILAALNSADWNRGRAAQILQCSRMTLYRKMLKFSV